MTAKELFHPKDIVLNNICNAIFDEQTLRDAMSYLQMVFNKKRIVISASSSGYPQIKYGPYYIRLHRIIGQYIYQDKDGIFQYHHIDENKLNSLSTNLQKITLSEHLRLHNKNRVMSEEQRRAISEARKGKPPGNVRAILMLDKESNIIQEFSSTYEAAKALSIWHTAITNNLNNRSKYCHKHKFVYKDEYNS